MTDEMDRMSDDHRLPESDGDGTGTGEGDFPSFEEALRAHGFEVEPPHLLDDPGLVGPESTDDDELAVDDDSTAPVLVDAKGGTAALGDPAGTESSLAALAASWIPRSSVAPPPTQSRGSVFGTVLTRPPVASAPWVTAPGPEVAPQLGDAKPAEEDAEALTVPAAKATAAEDLEEVEEPTLLDALAAAVLDEAPTWTEGEAGVIEMTTMEVTEVWDLPEPVDPLAERRKARRRRKDRAAAAKAAAAAAASGAAASEHAAEVEPVWTAGESGAVERTNAEVTEASDTSASQPGGAAQAAVDDIEDHWWIEPGATPEDAAPKLPQPPATLAEPRPPVPSASLFAGHLTSTHAGTSATDARPGVAEKVAGAEFVGYHAAAAARAAAAAEGRTHPSARPTQQRAEPEPGSVQPLTPDARHDNFEARLRAATKPLGYVAPPEDHPADAPAGRASEWSSSAATWEALHDHPWAAQAVADRVAPPHEREPFIYEAPVPPTEMEAPAAEGSDETPPEPDVVTESAVLSSEPELATETDASPPVTAGPDAHATEAFEATEVSEATQATQVTQATEATQMTEATEATERGNLWHLVSEKTAGGATAAPTAPDRLSILLTILVVFVIVVLVVGFIALFTNFFH